MTSAERLQYRKLVAAMDSALLSNGYRRQRTRWYKDFSESIAAITLQLSDYGPKYYVNVGVAYKALGPPVSPLEHDMHLLGRSGEIVTEADQMALERALDISNEVDDFRQVIRVIEHSVIPFHARISSIAGARQLWEAGDLKHMAIKLPLKSILASKGK